MKEHAQHWSIEWNVDDLQVEWTTEFYNQHKHTILVKTRHKRNVQKIGLDFSKEFVWKSLVACLLTSQQKSGPASKVVQLLRTDPFPLNLHFCLENIILLEKIAQEVLTSFGGIRRSTIIAQQLKINLQRIVGNDWFILKEIALYDIKMDDKHWEQSLAGTIQRAVVGFGPKQSRNFLQMLGITKYEIPLDSRIIDWLNKNNFPVHLTAVGLSDSYYYQFVSDGIQYLCEKANIYPCLLDAAIFSSYDNGKWTEENLVF
jgi:thermostable 8-oxoguanine DNA glycosylase